MRLLPQTQANPVFQTPPQKAGLHLPSPAGNTLLPATITRTTHTDVPRFSATETTKKLVPDGFIPRLALARKVKAGPVETLLILTGHPISKASRVELFRQRLAENPPAHNMDGALQQLEDTLKSVEDEYAPEGGAMAPLRKEKYVPEIFGKVCLLRGDSFKHIVLINEHGALEIRHKESLADNPTSLPDMLRRPLVIAKDSADGYGLWNRPKEA